PLDPLLMAKRVTKVVKRKVAAPKRLPKVASGELSTLLDHIRYATSRFNEAGLVFAHGTTEATVEAAFLVCESLHLHPELIEAFGGTRVTAAESKAILGLIGQRITTRKPTAYLVNKI